MRQGFFFVGVKPVSWFGEAGRSRVVMQRRLHHRAFVMNSGMKQSGHFCFPLRRKRLKTQRIVVIASAFDNTYGTRRGAMS